MRKISKKMIVFFLIGMIIFNEKIAQASNVQNGAIYQIETNTITDWPQGPEVYSETAVLMEAETGTILYDKGMNEKRYPASITKIMTALIALEHASLDEEVIFTDICLKDQEPGSGNIGMKVGEILTMDQCLHALMIQSANDVATQIAEHVGGSLVAFTDMMNKKAIELGCKDTHFANASGMPDENHYTTAYDMALIFREAIKQEKFCDIIACQSYTIEPTNLNLQKRIFTIHHPLAATSAPEYYEGCFGGKTGITNISKSTLVSGAFRNDMTLIAVGMRAELGEICHDQTQLFNYGFNNFQRIEVSDGNVILPNGKNISEIKSTEEISGEYVIQKYYYDETHQIGQRIEKIAIPTPEIVESTPEVLQNTILIPNSTKEERYLLKKINKIYKYIIYTLSGMIVVTCMITVVIARKRKRKQRKISKKRR